MNKLPVSSIPAAIALISLGSALGSLIPSAPAIALPGESVEEVVAWIQAHPTLQPAPGERLLIRKSDTPARRFTFQASLYPPGRATIERDNTIRSEQITLVDLINGVNRDRLEESLRIIYGREIYQDYEQAGTVYTYPTGQEPSISPTVTALQGEIRQGRYFAYWLETIQNQQGVSENGQITLFLIEDLPQVITTLEERSR